MNEAKTADSTSAGKRPGMRRRAAPWLVIAALLPASPAALADDVSSRDRLKLWNGCSPVDLIVEHLNEAAADIGLTREAVTVAVRSRLRAARLYGGDPLGSILTVDVNVAGQALHVAFAYEKWLKDDVSGEAGFVTTWQVYGIGTHGNNPGLILSVVSRYADEFVDEYLRVNADACQ